MIRSEVIVDIARRLKAAPRGRRSGIIGEEAARLGVSRGTIYAALRRLSGRRRSRADKGRRLVSEDAVRIVARIRAKASDKVAGRSLPTRLAIRVAETDGLIPAGAISRSTWDRIARGMQLRTQPRLYCRYQARRSNQLHHVDSTQSKYLRVLEERPDGDHLLAPRSPEYARKRSEEPLGVWCTGVVDDRSRVSFAVYAVAAGESARLVTDALCRAWSGDPRCALTGMPESLQCDHGPLRRSEEGQNFCERLGIVFADRMPNTPWAGGKGERPWRDLFRGFEMMFMLQRERVVPLSELNRRLLSWVDESNNRGHPWLLDRTRLRVYAESEKAEVRFVPENVADVIFHEHYRCVRNDGLVRFENVWYALPDKVAGRTVRIVHAADGRMVAEHEGEVFDLRPFEPHDVGEYRAHHYTPAQWIEQEATALEIARLPYDEPRKVLHLHRGEAAAVQTPFDDAARSFANVEEALAFLAREIALPLHEWPKPMYDAMVGLLRRKGFLLRDVVRDMAAEVKARLAGSA